MDMQSDVLSDTFFCCLVDRDCVGCCEPPEGIISTVPSALQTWP